MRLTPLVAHTVVEVQMTSIVDPEQPNYFPESFPRESFPAYVWTERPKDLPAEVWTTETTHRDCQHCGLPLTT